MTILLALFISAFQPYEDSGISIPLNTGGELQVSELISRISTHYRIEVELPKDGLSLATQGSAAALTKNFLKTSLGPECSIEFRDKEVVIRFEVVENGRLKARLADLAKQSESESKRRAKYGIWALGSYRPNDPSRPTVCLVHGLNSNSSVFVHMIKPLEEAGFGIVVYDYPYNRDLDKSSAGFADDWEMFRRRQGEELPWAIVAHSMGALLSRSYVEGDRYGGDVSTLALIAPANGGSELAGAQTLLQVIESTQSLNGAKSNPLGKLADGLGEAAADLTPGSKYLEALNRRARRTGVRYFILAGDGGWVSAATRKQVETQLAVLGRGGLIGGLAKELTRSQSGRLDELTEGFGDGCLSVARTKLDGVKDHVVIRANHLELIRAPLLYPDPGPVVSMPYLLKWLKGPEGRDR